MIEKIPLKLKLRSNMDLAVRSLISRPWYMLAHFILLTLCMSSFYIMIKLIYVIPSRALRGFSFFRRGGLEGSTDLLLFATGALLFSLLLVSVLTLRMQIRLSRRANRDNYLALIQIGMSRSELQHSMRLEGFILLCAGIMPSLGMSDILLDFLSDRWDLPELNTALSNMKYQAFFLSLFVCIVLLEFAHLNLVRSMEMRKDDGHISSKPLYQRFHRKAAGRTQVWFEIKNHSWRISRFDVLADILTLSVSFALIFFIYAIKAGINKPQPDRVATGVSYDLKTKDGALFDLKEETERLLTELPNTLRDKIDVIYLNEEATISVELGEDQLRSHFRDLLEDAGLWPSDNDGTNMIELEFLVYPLSKKDYYEYFDIHGSSLSLASYAENNNDIELNYEEWTELSGAILIEDLFYAEEGRILVDNFKPLELEAGSRLSTSEVDPMLSDLYITQVSDLRPWYMDPVNDRLTPVILVPESVYENILERRETGSWIARLRVNENSLISFHSQVKREWTARNTFLRVIDHHGRRMEQLRIHHSLDMLFNISLFFIIQLVLIQIIAFTQGQYFVREGELHLLHAIGLERRQERSIIRYHCLQVFFIALFMSYLLTFLASYGWNKVIREITAVSITWPLTALIGFSTGLTLATLIFSQIRFKKTADVHLL